MGPVLRSGVVQWHPEESFTSLTIYGARNTADPLLGSGVVELVQRHAVNVDIVGSSPTPGAQQGMMLEACPVVVWGTYYKGSNPPPRALQKYPVMLGIFVYPKSKLELR